VDLLGQIVEDTNLVAVEQQLVREMRADEAGTTRDQNAFHREIFRVVRVAPARRQAALVQGACQAGLRGALH
jgi:hypothetical protein